MAQPVMTAYESDLFHAAMFLQEHVNNIPPGAKVVFHWWLSPMHTWIMLEPVPATFYGGETDVHFRMTVELADNGWWTLTVEGIVTDRTGA